MIPTLHALLTRIALLVMIHTSHAKPLCHPDDSSALMEFKRSIRTTDRTSDDLCHRKIESWSLGGHGDCCLWDGVECDEATGHVTGLELRESCLFGSINSNTSLFRLLHLESLNLAWNNFNFSLIPYGFGNLSRLQYLNLSNSEFSGKVPSDISQLSGLIYLDLHNLLIEIPNIDNFLHNLTSLRELDLSGTSLSSPFPCVLANFSSLKSLKLADSGLHGEFPVGIFQLPNLEVLDISNNVNLYGFIPKQQWGNSLKSLSLRFTAFSGEIPVSMGNLVFLNTLSIAWCNFSGSLPSSLGNLSQLDHMDISRNKIHGQIPASFANLTELSHLELSGNQLSGPISFSFENLTQLIELRLSSNNLQGEIPNSLWELKDLQYLRLGENNLSGTVDLHNLKKLEVLYLSSNNISFVSKTEINTTLPNLWALILDSCNLHEFPEFLRHRGKLEYVDLSHNNIGGSIPTWMWNGSRETLSRVDLSHNSLISFVDGQINLPLPRLEYLDISSNSLKTKFPNPPPSVGFYNISRNYLFGEIHSICGARSLVSLDLSLNSLNGTIPSCLLNMDSLLNLNLGKNKLQGTIPLAYPKDCALLIIDLTENQLQGPIPISLVNCSKLEYLNLGYNQILDGFPLWLSELSELKVIILKANRFHGPIETYRSRFNFSNLHIMDFSNNNFNGELPSKLLQSLHAMKAVVHQDQLEYINTREIGSRVIDHKVLVKDYFSFGMKLLNKGIEREYSKVPYALMEIDLSNNKFVGRIPDLIGHLKSLISLNLSNNFLTSSIPPSLANLTNLESLDLSQNNLSGRIPQQLAQLNFLSFFGVSRNQLSGAIPQGGQFSTFKSDSFAMNEGLCGPPLPKRCTITPPPSLDEANGKESPFNLEWKVVLFGAGVGFLTGFVLGNLIIDEKSRWFVHYSKRMAGRWSRLGRH